MKNIYLIVITVSLSFNSVSQSVQNIVYTGGMILESYHPTNTYSGNQIYDLGIWDIDSILDSGTPVILDIFATWCGPCWTFHNSHKLNNFYDTRGWGGTQEVAIFGVEGSFSTAPDSLESPFKDWIDNTKYPMANLTGALNIFNSSYYPTILMICPDRKITYFGSHTSINQTVLSQALDNCGDIATDFHDLRIIQNNTVDELYICGTNTDTLELKFIVQNYGTAAINSFYTFNIYDVNSNLVSTFIKHIELLPYYTSQVEIEVVVSEGLNSFMAKIDTPNDNILNDSIVIETEVFKAIDFMMKPSMELDLSMEIDLWGEEVGVVFNDGIPNSYIPQDEYNLNTFGNSIFYEPLTNTGAIYHGLNQFDTTLTISNYGCHYFVFYDSFHDGIAMTAGNEQVTISSNQTLVIDGDYDEGVVILLNLVSVLQIDNNIENMSFNVYPNPSNGNFSILKPNNLLDFKLNIYDLTGKDIAYSIINSDEKAINLQTSFKGVAIVKYSVNNKVYISKVILN